jgi:hypothetical protein
MVARSGEHGFSETVQRTMAASSPESSTVAWPDNVRSKQPVQILIKLLESGKVEVGDK